MLITAFGVASVRREWLNVDTPTARVRRGPHAFKSAILPAAAPAVMTRIGSRRHRLAGDRGGRDARRRHPIGYFVWNEWNNSVANIVTAIPLIGLVGLVLDEGLARLTRLVTYPQ